MKFMKKFLLLSAFVLFSNNVLSQNLTLAQILEIKKKDLGNAEEYLTAKGWEFKEAEEPTYDKLGKAIFTYNKSGMSNKAESFLIFFYDNYSDKTRISIQVHIKTKYNEYINAIKSFGCKLIKSKVENGDIVKVYRGATTTFKVTSSTSTNIYNAESAIWTLSIITNEDYDLYWGEE